MGVTLTLEPYSSAPLPPFPMGVELCYFAQGGKIYLMLRTALTLLSLFTFSLTVSAGPITYSNLGASPNFHQTGGVGLNSINSVATDFTTIYEGSLYSLELAIGRIFAPNFYSAGLTVSLVEPGALPTGNVLESWNLSPASLPTLSTCGTNCIVELQSIVQPFLAAGQTYWVRVDTSSAITYAWAFGFGPDDGYVVKDGTNNWMTNSGAVPSLEVTMVPEPSGALLAIGGIGVLLAWRRRAKSEKVTPTGL